MYIVNKTNQKKGHGNGNRYCPRNEAFGIVCAKVCEATSKCHIVRWTQYATHACAQFLFHIISQTFWQMQHFSGQWKTEWRKENEQITEIYREQWYIFSDKKIHEGILECSEKIDLHGLDFWLWYFKFRI